LKGLKKSGLGAPENIKTLQASKLADPLQPSTGAASAAAAAALLGVDVPRQNVMCF